MPPRRRRANAEMEEEMRRLLMRLDAIETPQRRAPDTGDISEAESEEEVEGEAHDAKDVAQDRLIKVVSKIGARARIEVPMYEGNLVVEELLDWVRAIDKYFDYEDIEEDKMVKYAVTRLKGHAALWWDELQVECRRNGKQKNKNWDSMVAKLKAKFISKDYQINLYRRLQNLKQRGLSVKEYTEDFYRLNIRAGQKENEGEKTTRYINGIRYEIQDEISMMSVSKVEDAYQAALKAEENLAKRQSQ
jgi:hypothetical protein